jgi:hypothetical protein
MDHSPISTSRFTSVMEEPTSRYESINDLDVLPGSSYNKL